MSSMQHNSSPPFPQLSSDSLAFYCRLQVWFAQADQIISFCVCQVSRDLLTQHSSLLAHFHVMSDENINIIDKCGTASTGSFVAWGIQNSGWRVCFSLNLMVFRCKETNTKKPFDHLQTPLPALSRQYVSQYSSLTTWYSCRQVPLKHRGKK